MAVLNPSFEDAGLLPSEAEHWTLRSRASLEAIAGFGPSPAGGPELAWEGFERWVALWLVLEDVPIVRAFFDSTPEGFEDFEEVWENDIYLWELPPSQQLPASLGPDHVEDCEGGWDNGAYAWAWATVSSVVGVFDGEPREDFEARWSGNQTFTWTWSALSRVAARFDARSQPHEDFDTSWPTAATL